MQISDAEWQVMKIIGCKESRQVRIWSGFWRSGSTGPSRPFKLFWLVWLRKSAWLGKKEGKSFVYSALLTLDQSRDLLVQDIKDKVCSRRIKNLLADLIAECDFTLADLEDLEAVISKKKSSAVTEVRCNCM